MTAEDRSLSDIVQDVIRNVQEIVRSEVRLAKTEILEDAAKAKSATLLFGAGAVTAIFAILFLLLGSTKAGGFHLRGVPIPPSRRVSIPGGLRVAGQRAVPAATLELD